MVILGGFDHFQACRKLPKSKTRTDLCASNHQGPWFKGDPNNGLDELEPNRSYFNHIPSWYAQYSHFYLFSCRFCLFIPISMGCQKGRFKFQLCGKTEQASNNLCRLGYDGVEVPFKFTLLYGKERWVKTKISHFLGRKFSIYIKEYSDHQEYMLRRFKELLRKTGLKVLLILYFPPVDNSVVFVFCMTAASWAQLYNEILAKVILMVFTEGAVAPGEVFWIDSIAVSLFTNHLWIMRPQCCLSRASETNLINHHSSLTQLKSNNQDFWICFSSLR